ncbi:MAG: fibronectin type III domain-containing protein, partial [Allorhizobium sp.]
MVAPGPPAAVTISVLSGSSILVDVSASSSTGGDEINKYRVEWDTAPTFDSGVGAAPAFVHDIEHLRGGSPYSYVLRNLNMGVAYYVRVRAHNSIGFSEPRASSPPFEVPRQIPSAPNSVRLGVTSDTMLTVGFTPPSNVGGDDILSYVVEWDRLRTFDGLCSPCTNSQRGLVEVPAASAAFFTITGLSPGVP